MTDRKRELGRLVLRLAAGAAVFVALLWLVDRSFRPQLEGIGQAFVRELGYAGMFVGSFLADSISFPVPAQAYMIAATKGGASPVLSFACIALGTVAGAVLGRAIGILLARVGFIERRLAVTRDRFLDLSDRWGPLAVVLVTLLPLPFSLLVYASGAYGLSKRLFALLVALRVPKLLVIFLVIRWTVG